MSINNPHMIQESSNSLRDLHEQSFKALFEKERKRIEIF